MNRVLLGVAVYVILWTIPVFLFGAGMWVPGYMAVGVAGTTSLLAVARRRVRRGDLRG